MGNVCFFDERPVYAEKGEMVVCEKGHDVFSFTKTVHYGACERGSFAKFADNQIRPKRDGKVNECRCHCGSRWAGGKKVRFDLRFKSNILLFKNGWRNGGTDEIQS